MDTIELTEEEDGICSNAAEDGPIFDHGEPSLSFAVERHRWQSRRKCTRVRPAPHDDFLIGYFG